MDQPTDDRRGELGRLCSLDDPKRQALYEYVVAQAEPVTRDEASDAVGIERSTAAYHLDKLVDQGLLAASFARPDGRGGPGAGRPAKHYARAEGEITVSVPPRDYRLLAELLAAAIDGDDDGRIEAALQAAAHRHGAGLADGEVATTAELRTVLDRYGFQPFDDGDTIRLRNCPFHRLARQHTELVCTMNLALMRGLLEDADLPVDASLDPAPDRCCVAFTP